MAPLKKQKVEEESRSEEEEKLAMAEDDDDDEEYEDGDDGYEEQKAPPGYERGRYSDDSDVEPEDYKHPDYLYYMQRIRDSNGFDVPPQPKGLKVPYYVARCEDMKILGTLSIQAIDYYNKLHLLAFAPYLSWLMLRLLRPVMLRGCYFLLIIAVLIRRCGWIGQTRQQGHQSIVGEDGAELLIIKTFKSIISN